MSYPLLDVFLTMTWFFLWVLWIYMVFWIIWDVMSSPDLSGWAKAGWMVLTILVPFVGVLVYLIVRGSTMHERRGRRARRDAYGDYPRTAANGDGDRASEITRLADLRDRSVITEDEFQQGKARILG